MTKRPQPRTVCDRGSRVGQPARILFGVLTAALILAGGSSAATGTSKPILRFAVNLPSTHSLNPAVDGPDTLVPLAYENLLHMNPNGSLSPGLALSWHFYSTGRGSNKDFALTLRHNARFSDGTPVTAAAVINWLKYFVKANGPGATQLNPNPTFSTSGKWIVQIHLETPDPELPEELSEYFGDNIGAVASPKAVTDPTLFTNQSDGAGPYKLDPAQTVPGDHYTYVPNPYYYNKSAIKWSQIDVKNIASPSSTLQALNAGQVEAAIGDLSTYKAAEAAGLNVQWTRASTIMLVLDRSGKSLSALGDVRVRQALNYAIDRSAIVKALLPGGTPTSAYKTTDGVSARAVSFYPYNPAKAKALLAAAGYSNGFTLDAVDAPSDPYSAVIDAVANNLAAVGVNMKITVAPSTGAWVGAFSTSPAVVLTNGALPTSSNYIYWYSPTAFLNPGHVNNHAMDKAWVQGLKAKNPTPYWQTISLLATEDAYLVPVGNPATPFYSSKKLGGVSATDARPMYLPTEWYPKP